MPVCSFRGSTVITRVGDYILMTNFDSSRLAGYEKALKIYNETIPEKDRCIMVIGSASHQYSDHGIWKHAEQCSSKGIQLFWGIHEIVKNENTNKEITESHLFKHIKSKFDVSDETLVKLIKEGIIK